MLTRRRFVASLAAAFASGFLRDPQPASEKPAGTFGSLPGLYAAETRVRRASRYIDVHTHVGTYTNDNRELTVRGLLDWMDAHDVERAVVLPLVSPESTTYLQTSESALKAAAEHPDRLVAFCAVDPRSILVGGLRGLIDVLQRYVDQGARGFGEHKVGLDFDDPLMMRVYEACQETGLPLLFHCDTVRGRDEPGLPRLERALREFPDLAFIGHGPGFWASISGDVKERRDLGGYPKGSVAPGGALDRLMERYPNLYGDLSAGSGANAIGRDRPFGREFLVRRQDRLLFGTDYLQPGQDVPQFELLDSFDLPQEARIKIERGNAVRLLELA